MNLLALDIATKTGFACEMESGVVDLKIKSNESKGVRLIRFKSFLDRYVPQYQIDMIVFERAAGRFKNALNIMSQLHGVLMLYCEENNIEYTSVTPKEIKKFATGKGNASKDDMIQAYKDKYGKDPLDDNEADAQFMYDYAKTLYK